MSETQTDTIPPEPETKGKGKAKPATPEFVFVENAAKGPRTLFWRDEETPGTSAAKSKILGPGLNWTASTIVAKNTIKGRFADGFGGLVRVVDPCQLPIERALELARNSASRQAVIEWRRIETRPEVLKAIAERLARRGPPSDSLADDED